MELIVEVLCTREELALQRTAADAAALDRAWVEVAAIKTGFPGNWADLMLAHGLGRVAIAGLLRDATGRVV